MKVRIKKLNPKAVIPSKAHSTDAGFDLHCTGSSIDWGMQEVTCHTGLAFEIPKGYAGLIFPRSSICKKPLMLHNAVGVIDSCYRGEVTAKFVITDPRMLLMEASSYQEGDRIAQMIIMPYPEIEFEEAEELSETERGEGGYGSTGK
ncbi:MAG TPA: dUTP diphosphatase [Lachnospiraceae bacterium]|nr:dUTP diphosphatase [Lachnospiraceae bacterium]